MTESSAAAAECAPELAAVPTSLPSAALGWRAVAALYDLFPLIALWMATGAIGFAATHGDLDARSPPLWYRLALLAVTVAYFVVSWMRGGQTIGMRAWRLRVERADGARLTLLGALLRFVVAGFSLAAAGAGMLWSLVDRDRRTWHDLAAKTRVVRVSKR
jgi:uncharacterized RDD family membrane protein YckC